MRQVDHCLTEHKMGWELRKKRLIGEPPLPKLFKLPKLRKLPRLPQVPKILRPPKPEAPPGHEYYWRDD
jgi:hypothetical protein